MSQLCQSSAGRSFASFRPPSPGCRALLLTFSFVCDWHSSSCNDEGYCGGVVPTSLAFSAPPQEAYIPSCPHRDKHAICNYVRSSVPTFAYRRWSFTWYLPAIFLGIITCQPNGLSTLILLHIHLIRPVYVEASAICAGKSRNVLSYRAMIVGPARSKYRDFQAG